MTKVCIPDTFSDINPSTNKPYANDFIGKKVTGINNTKNGNAVNSDWIIADYNHCDRAGAFNLDANASNTFDLISERTVTGSVAVVGYVHNDSPGRNQNYEFSNTRNWIIEYANTFDSSIKDRLAVQDVMVNLNSRQKSNIDYGSGTGNYTDTTGTMTCLNDNIKLLSYAELGFDPGINGSSNIIYNSKYINEGNKYPIFTSKNTGNTQYSDIKKLDYRDNYAYWWTRSRSCNANNFYTLIITNTGTDGAGQGPQSYNIVPCIRIKATKYTGFRDFLNADIIEEDDFINYVLKDQSVFTYNEAANFIGKRVKIKNSTSNTYNVNWIIIGYNHIDDPTVANTPATNTFDLMAEYCIDNGHAHRSSGINNQNYEFSEARTWLIDTYYQGFSTALKNKIRTMNVVYNFNRNQPENKAYGSGTYDATGELHILQDNIKMPSAYELGFTGGSTYRMPIEGSIYSDFFSTKSGDSDFPIMRAGEGYYAGSSTFREYSTRSRSTDSNYPTSYLCIATSPCRPNTSSSSTFTRPIIRVGV